MSFKAKLTVILKADDTVVAESDDPILWQNTLLSINSQQNSVQQKVITPPNPQFINNDPPVNPNPDDSDPINKLSKELSIGKDVLIGACSPSNEKPFIHLDKHHWEALKKNLPAKGTNAVAAAAIGASILVLWKEAANLGDTQQKEIAAVLGTIGVNDKNPKRSIDNCEWLQIRNGKILINPAETSKAINLVKAYCMKSNPDNN